MTTETKPAIPAPAAQPIPYAAITEPQPIPKWVGFMVALVIVGSMFGGGGLWAWSYYNRPDPKNLTEVRSITLPTGVRVGTPAVQPARTIIPGIVQSNPTTYQVTGGDFTLMASKNGADWTLRLIYRKSDLLTPDQQAARMARMRLATDPLFAKSLNVTDEQVTKLKAIPASMAAPALVVAPAELDNLKKLWTPFIAANPPKPADGQKIIAAVQDAGKASLEATRTSLLPDIKKIQEVLTPEQIAPFKQ